MLSTAYRWQASDVQSYEHAAAGADHVRHAAHCDLGDDGRRAQHSHPQLLRHRHPAA